LEYRSVYITARDEPEARRLGHSLVWEKLAACVNYFPIKSIYWWNGKVEESAEVALIAKTRAELVDDLIQRVKELHSYQIPCTESWVIEKADPDCAKWVEESTRDAITKKQETITKQKPITKNSKLETRNY
jgi:periplasmic divalent cation tolerance protein